MNVRNNYGGQRAAATIVIADRTFVLHSVVETRRTEKLMAMMRLGIDSIDTWQISRSMRWRRADREPAVKCVRPARICYAAQYALHAALRLSICLSVCLMSAKSHKF